MKNIKRISLILLLISGVGLNLGLQANSAFSQTTDTQKETIENQEECCCNHENNHQMGNNHEMMISENAQKCQNHDQIFNNSL